MRTVNKTKTLQNVGITEADKKNLKKMVLSSTNQVSEKELEGLIKKFEFESSLSDEQKMKAAFDKAGSTFDTLAKMTTVKVDRQLQDDLLKAVVGYEDASGQSIPVLNNILNRVGTLAQQHDNMLKTKSTFQK